MDFTLSKLLDSLESSKEEVKTSMRATTEAYKRASQPKPPVDKMLAPAKEATLRDLLYEKAKERGLPPKILEAVAIRESGALPPTWDILQGINRAGAAGLMQQKENFAKDWKVVDRHNPVDAIEGAARALGHYYKVFNGDLNKALAAYNWGIGNMGSTKLENAPKETKDYILDVNRHISGAKMERIPTKHFNELLDTPISKWRKNER